MIKTILLGRLTRDVELRSSASGVSIAKFTVACNTGIVDKDGNKETEFVNCTSFNKQAETIAKYFGKGNMIAIVGRNKTSKYTDKNGIDKYSTDVIVDSFEFVDKKDNNVSEKPKTETNSFSEDNIQLQDDDLPF